MQSTIGFLTANIHIGAAQPLWRGVLDAAEAENANLIGFPGGRLRVPEDFENQRNFLYALINTTHLNGLVSWTSALAGPRPPASDKAWPSPPPDVGAPRMISQGRSFSWPPARPITCTGRLCPWMGAG
jgi:hypothetical protein